MNLEQQVTSLELSKRLKELGVKQDSYFQWGRMWRKDIAPEKQEYELFNGLYTPSSGGAKEYWSAFTVAELGEMLPSKIRKKKNNGWDGLQIWKHNGHFNIEYHETFEPPNIRILAEGLTEADARAKMLIYLIENKLNHSMKTHRTDSVPTPPESSSEGCCEDCKHAHLDDSGLVDGYSCMNDNCPCHTPHTTVEEAIEQELHNYGAWLLNNPNAEPLERRAEKRRRAQHIVTTLATSQREQGRREMIKMILENVDEETRIDLESYTFIQQAIDKYGNTTK